MRKVVFKRVRNRGEWVWFALFITEMSAMRVIKKIREYWATYI